jgi:N6-adenosine-specific RNA methylase IME4
MNELAKIDSYCELTKTNLSFKRDVSKNKWMDVFKALKQVEGCVQFWIGDCLAYREQRWGMYDDIAEETGYETETLRQYKRISENVKSGTRVPELSFMHHREVASLTTEKQELFLNKAAKEKLSVRELREEIRRIDIEEKIVDFPTGKYRIFYADPPWKYSNSMPASFIEQANHYQLMDLEDIKCLKIKDISEENAVLFLWATSPILAESFEVIKAWGFEYKSSIIWDKEIMVMGHYVGIQHELLLICTKGSCTPFIKELLPSVVRIKKEKHSKKPDEFRKIIEKLYPYGNRIELFARKKNEGWEVWGNES